MLIVFATALIGFGMSIAYRWDPNLASSFTVDALYIHFMLFAAKTSILYENVGGNCFHSIRF